MHKHNDETILRLTRALYELYQLTKKDWNKVSIELLFAKHQAPYTKIIGPVMVKEGYIETRKVKTANEYRWINGEPASADAIRLMDSICSGSSKQDQDPAKKEIKTQVKNSVKVSTSPEKKPDGLQNYATDQIVDELRRRGYKGTLTSSLTI